MPEISGILISIKTTSKSFDLSASMASCAELTLVTLQPSFWRMTLASLRFMATSSTTRARMGEPGGRGGVGGGCGLGWTAKVGGSLSAGALFFSEGGVRG